MGWHRRRGWGPPRNRRVVIHHGGGGGFLGGLVGGVVGGVIGSSAGRDRGHDHPPQRVHLPSYLDDIIERVTEVPEDATVYLKIDEFRVLVDKNMITYEGKDPYCMGRRIEVQ